MKFDLSNKVSLAKFRFRSEKLIKEEKLVDLTAASPVRSNQQNRYLHVLIAYFAVEYGETRDYVKDKIFKQTVNVELFKTTFHNKKNGMERVDWKSSSDLDTAEMTLAIERFRNYAAKEANIYLPSPGEDEFLKHCQVMIDEHKEYI